MGPDFATNGEQTTNTFFVYGEGAKLFKLLIRNPLHNNSMHVPKDIEEIFQSAMKRSNLIEGISDNLTVDLYYFLFTKGEEFQRKLAEEIAEKLNTISVSAQESGALLVLNN